jgi:hypothetical protein
MRVEYRGESVRLGKVLLTGGGKAGGILPADALPLYTTVTGTIRVFVNTSALDLPAGADVAAAVRAFDRDLVEGLAAGAVLVTDGRGIEVAPDEVLAGGAILRVIVRARRESNADT